MPSWTFHEAPTNVVQALRALPAPGVFEYMAHLERLDGFEIYRFHYVPLTDELDVMARYAGHEVHIWMDWGGDVVVSTTDTVPMDVFRHVCEHLKAYRPVARAELARAKDRYAKIAKSANS